MTLTKEQLQVLQHSIGADQYGRSERGCDRNFFGTNANGKDGQVCQSLVALGLMEDHGFRELYRENVYTVTGRGVDAVLKFSPAPPKLSRSQQRYLDFLRTASDCYSFGEWLKMQKHRKLV
jgi:hypothetical protein